MEISRADKILWRFNGVLIATAGIAALFLMAFAGYKVIREVFGYRRVNSVVNVVEGRTQRETFSLRRFSPIQGSPWLAAGLEAEQEYQHSYYSKAGSSTRNYLFFNTLTSSSNWLLANNSSLILAQHEILEDVPKVNKEEQKIVGILYEVILNDTNSDGRLNFEDKRSLMLYRFSEGRGVTLLDGVDEFLGVNQKTPNEVVIFFRENGSNFFVPLNVTSGTIGEKKELPSVPATGQ